MNRLESGCRCGIQCSITVLSEVRKPNAESIPKKQAEVNQSGKQAGVGRQTKHPKQVEFT